MGDAFDLAIGLRLAYVCCPRSFAFYLFLCGHMVSVFLPKERILLRHLGYVTTAASYASIKKNV